MATEIDLEQQIPPKPGDPEQFGQSETRRTGYLAGNRFVKRMRAWLRFGRIKLAQAILLPELSPGQARDLREAVRDDARLTRGYVLMSGLSAGIAVLGLLQSSTAVVIGAMLISPLMNPIAGLGFGFASLDGRRIREAARVVAVGSVIGILVGVLLTWLSPIRNATPEILSRTQPTLLDLAVALFSGLAGGYATVIRKGGTAIGVAIATALMPPLAVVGYGIGVLQIQFALGAFLLFLTNLAAITFSFALIARLSNAARPLYKVEWRPRYVAIFVVAFLVLATPLTMSLARLSYEASMRSAATSAIVAACGGKNVDIAQLEVSWPLFDEPTVDALVVAPTYSPNAEQDAEERLAKLMGERVLINLQQVQATDFQSQTRAMIDAAMERTAAGIAADVPPYDRIRANVGLPTRGIWANRAERRVYLEPVPAPGWTLTDYAEVERTANAQDSVWNVRIVPPAQPVLRVWLGEAAEMPEDTITPQLARWALRRWGMSKVRMEAPEIEAVEGFIERLAESGVAVEHPKSEVEGDAPPRENTEPVAIIQVFGPSPTAAAAAAAAAAEREREEREMQAATAD